MRGKTCNFSTTKNHAKWEVALMIILQSYVFLCKLDIFEQQQKHNTNLNNQVSLWCFCETDFLTTG
jgi:hypothetical protein